MQTFLQHRPLKEINKYSSGLPSRRQRGYVQSEVLHENLAQTWIKIKTNQTKLATVRWEFFELKLVWKLFRKKTLQK